MSGVEGGESGAPRYALRAAVLADIPVLQAVERDADARFGEGGEVIPEEHARRAIARGQITVAEVSGEGEGEVVGWVYLGSLAGDPGEPPEPCIGQISVRVAHGRQGIGTALLREAIEAARESGARSVVLNTYRAHPWNAPWYARHGFVEVPEGAWSRAMRAVTEAQVAAGLDWSRRLHMRKVL